MFKTGKMTSTILHRNEILTSIRRDCGMTDTVIFESPYLLRRYECSLGSARVLRTQKENYGTFTKESLANMNY